MIKYLSPSSLKAYESMPYTFFLERMLKAKPRDPQSVPASAGSAFDAYIKCRLAKKLDILDKVYNRAIEGSFVSDKQYLLGLKPAQGMFEISVDLPNRDIVKDPCILLSGMYAESKTCQQTKWLDFELQPSYSLMWKGAVIPIWMKLDAAIEWEGQRIIHDWKVKGFSSDTSPPAKYVSIETLGDGSEGILEGPHKGYYHGVPMHEINPDWGDQLTTYSWALGNPVGKEVKAVIDCLSKRNGTWRVSRYLGVLTESNQLALAERYYKTWQDLRHWKQTVSLDIMWIMSKMERYYD